VANQQWVQILRASPVEHDVGVAVAAVIGSAAFGVPCYFLTKRILRLEGGDFVSNLRQPLLCTVCVTAAVLAAKLATDGLGAGSQLAVIAGVGTLVYCGAMLTFGRSELRTITAAFRPPTPEAS